jgi:DNA-binding winged helix-turn-helix (wHTH) protein/TolB-like protein/Tfp pilus assembly protein PilF
MKRTLILLPARFRRDIGCPVLGTESVVDNARLSVPKSCSQTKENLKKTFRSTMDSLVRTLYEFGPFQLDPAERLLLHKGRPVPVTPKAFDMLVVFVERSGHLVDKEELMSAVWPDSFVEEGNLCVTVSLLRKALSVDPDEHKYIETVSKRGYRFSAGVKQLSSESFPPAQVLQVDETAIIEVNRNAPTALTPPPFVPPHTLPLASRWRVLFLAAGLIIAALISSRVLLTRVKATVQPTIAVRSFAILPFQTLGAKSDDEYLGLGVADAVITKLANSGKIVVRPTSAIQKYAGANQDPLVAGREQAVDAVLGGRIQREGDRIRLTVQLIRVRDGAQLWADSIDEKFTNIFAVEDEVSEQVAQSIRLKLTGEEKKRFSKRSTGSREAYQAYIKGRYFWNKRTEDGIAKGLNYFQQAIALDPNFAEAYVGIADSYATLGLYSLRAPKEAFPAAKDAARKALEMDDGLAEAHATLGLIYFYYDWNGLAAENEFRKAFDGNANYAMAHSWNGENLVAMGRFPEALQEASFAQEDDPLSLIINTNAGWTQFLAGHRDQAIETLKKAIEIDPTFPRAHFRLGSVYEQMGMYDKAIAELQKAVQLSDGNSYYEGSLGHSYAVSGDIAGAHKVLDLLQKRNGKEHVPAYAIAAVYAGLGETEPAFASLKNAFEDRSASMVFLKMDPAFATLHSDPRFAQLTQRLSF